MSDEDRFLDMLEKVSKSVVHVNTVKVVHDFYHRTFPVKGTGSGFIIDSNGLVVTNAHVVSNAERIGVVLYDNNLVEGTIIGACQSIDTAVIKLDAKDLPFAELGDSDKLRVGQRVYAIGNPFGLEGGPSITSGVISAVNRTIQSGENLFINLVQTDAAINPGNSGGPLVDALGRVIAVNTAIIPYAQGIGFAVPINAVRECVEQIKNDRRFMRPWIGVYGISITPQIATYYGLSSEWGFLVTNIVTGSPAYKSELIPGDIITRVDDAPISSAEDLKKKISLSNIGETVKIHVLRGKQKVFLNLTIEGR
ncbi:MAG: S1C family serine protease [Candidatus Bathyarchaeia archaeon]